MQNTLNIIIKSWALSSLVFITLFNYVIYILVQGLCEDKDFI